MNEKKIESAVKKPTCGIIMPISDVPPYEPGHWQRVRIILEDAICDANFEPKLVSDSRETNIIQKNIVHNVHDNEMVICDISSRNPNVYFELGMRLTFDKPIVIVTDKITKSPFDTSIIQYIEYPESLRHPDIIKFKSDVASKIKDTYDAAKAKGYSSFLKHMGGYKPTTLHSEEVAPLDYVMKQLSSLEKKIDNINSQQDAVGMGLFSATTMADLMKPRTINKVEGLTTISGTTVDIVPSVIGTTFGKK